MIFIPIYWFFGLIAYIFFGVLMIGATVPLIVYIVKRKKSKKSINWIVAGLLAIVLVVVSSFSFMTSRNVWHWMSELNIYEDPNEVAEDERREVWYQFEPFGDNTKTISVDFESSLIITERFPRLDGATAFLPVYSAIAETIYSGLDVVSAKEYINLSTTRLAYEKLIKGDVDIIFTLQPSENQLRDARFARVELIKTPIFKEAFVFFVNDINPVLGLTVEQIQEIYTGKITNWQNIGGHNEKIAPYQRNVNSGSQTIMEQVVMSGLTMIKPETELNHSTMGMMLRSVAQYSNNENALGYSFRFYATVMNPQDGLRLLNVNNIAPTPENIANESYPFIVNVYAITTEKGLENPNTLALIDWLTSPQGQRLIEQTGYISITKPEN
ncbi:MAG: substrate-binding domain-containing protein [Oscillospiraceae bacterium]|nr:substrate-binding domain-containing protein [Oscillospiraceae bacterium]